MKKYFILALLSIGLFSCNLAKENNNLIKSGSYSKMIEHEGEWNQKDNYTEGIKGTIISQNLYSGKEYTITVKMSLDSIGFTNTSLILFDNILNFDTESKGRDNPVITLSGAVVDKNTTIAETNKHITNGKPFEFDIISNYDSIKFFINKHHLYSCVNNLDRYGRLGVKAGKSSVKIYDFITSGLNEKEGEISYLFKSGTESYHTFRIPAIAVSNKGTVLAFSEGRVYGDGDQGDIDLLVKRSEDGGKTWGNPILVLDDGVNTTGNVTPLLDGETGKIFVLSTWNLEKDYEWQIIEGISKDTRRIFVTESSDDGLSWTPAKEITKDVKLPNWSWYATGPCHGIQIQNGKYKGRLIIPCDHIELGSKKYYSHVIYSDDHGKTWNLGGTTPTDMVNECSVAELEDGSLMLNMRNYDRNVRNRKVAISNDGGETWGELYSDSALIEPICQGSLYRYSFKEEGKGILLFLNPSDEKERRNMTLKLSYDDGKSWAKSKVIYDGPSAYSDLVRLPNGNIGCLYEAGYISPYEGLVYKEISLESLEK